MDTELRREPQLLILHQLLEPAGLLGAQKSGLGPGWGGVMAGAGVMTEKYPAVPRPHLEPPRQQDLVPGLT